LRGINLVAGKVCQEKIIRGFTLLELLLATVLYSFIALVVYNIFTTGIRINAKSSREFAVCREARLAFELMAREIENSFSYDLSGSYPGQVSFFGSSSALRFFLPSKDGIQCVEYFLGLPDFGIRTQTVIGQRTDHLKRVIANSRQEDLRQFLIRRQKPFAACFLPGSKGDEEIIASGVIRGTLKFSYSSAFNEQLSGNESGLPMDWKDRWEDTSLPVAVKVEMKFQDEGSPAAGGINLSRCIILPLPAEALRRSGGISAGPETRHTLDVRHLDSVKEFKQ